MNSNFAAGAGVGGVIGFGVAWALAHFYYKRKVEVEVNRILAEADTARDEARAKKAEENAGDSESDGDGGKDGEKEKKEDDDSDEEDHSKLLNKYGGGTTKTMTDYREFYPDPAEMESPPDDRDEEYREVYEYEKAVARGEIITDENRDYIRGEEISNEMNSGKKPKLITEESYKEDYPHHEKIELAYYTGDGTIGDCLVEIEHNEEVFDEDRLVGDCLDRYGFRDNSEDTIYVRNFNYSADYKIIKKHKAWDGDSDFGFDYDV